MPNFSPHASLRSAQRAVPVEHIELALDWGSPIPQREGRTAWHLGDREVMRARGRGVLIPDRAIGVIVILAADDTIVTVVRSHDRRWLKTQGQRPWSRRRPGGGR